MMGSVTIPVSQHVTHRQRVRDLIQEMIISGQRRSDERLVQQELANQFGVSQGVVREALIDLQYSGLVRSVDKLGMFVNKIGIKEVLQSSEIREVLDGLAAKLCCDQASRADVARLYEMNDEIFHLGETGQQKERGVVDRAMHDHIVTCSDNEVLERLVEGYRMLGLAVQARRAIDVVCEEHRQVIAAIEQGSPEQAEHYAREHVRLSRESLKSAVEAGEFSPAWVVGTSVEESVET